MQRRRQIFSILLMALAAVGLQTFIVRAHADYERSDPPAGATLTEAPTQVQIWFTQELFRRQGENYIQVYTADGERVDLDDAVISDDDRTLMTVSLAPDLADGIYTVRWRALSADDGHAEDGEFTFTVGDAATAPTEASPAADDADEPTITPTAIESTAATATATPTEAPTGSSGGLPCASSSALIVFVLGAVFIGRREYQR